MVVVGEVYDRIESGWFGVVGRILAPIVGAIPLVRSRASLLEHTQRRLITSGDCLRDRVSHGEIGVKHDVVWGGGIGDPDIPVVGGAEACVVGDGTIVSVGPLNM